jgi:hypothetical protein
VTCCRKRKLVNKILKKEGTSEFRSIATFVVRDFLADATLFDCISPHIFILASLRSIKQEDIHPNMERELSGGNQNTAKPQLDGAAQATENVVMEEAPKESPGLPRQIAAGEEAAEKHLNGDVEPDNGTQATFNQDAATSSTSVQTNAIFANASQTSSLQPLQRSSAADGNTSDTAASMPPPAAPASMLSSLQSSGRVNAAPKLIGELSVIGYLIPACVTLFRQDSAAEARKLGQYTIDLVGKEAWNAELPTYMAAPPEPDDREQVVPLLQAAVKIIAYYDLTCSAFLDGMMYVWT